MKALNLSIVKESWYIAQLRYLFSMIAGQIDHLLDLLDDLLTLQGKPLGDQPYLLSAVLSFVIDSSTKTSCSAVKADSIARYRRRRVSLRCRAYRSTYTLFIKCTKRYIVLQTYHFAC